MKFHDGERGTVAKLGGNPPMRLILVCKNTEEALLEKATVSITFTDKVKDVYVKFTDGNPEQADWFISGWIAYCTFDID